MLHSHLSTVNQTQRERIFHNQALTAFLYGFGDDFVINRIEKPSLLIKNIIAENETKVADFQWHQVVEFHLVPHPLLKHPETIAHEYGMVILQIQKGSTLNSELELNKAKHYILDLTSGSLLIAESRLVAETLLLELSKSEWNRLFTDDNILQKKSQHTATRYAGSVRKRLKPLGEAFIEAIIHAPESQYKQLLMLALMIHTPALPDFMQHVVAETKRIYKPNLASDAWDSFLLDRMRTLPGLNDLSATTLQKSGNNIIRSLVEAGYLDNNKNRRLQPVYVLPETKMWLQKLNRQELEAIMECTL